MEPIHRAAYDGDVAAIDRLVAEDGERLNARNQVELHLERFDSWECTPLMLAAYRGQDAAVARLLALGADVGLQSAPGSLATHWACSSSKSSCLALLLDAGASLTARTNRGRTPLMVAAERGATACVTLLLARFGDVGEQVGTVDNDRNTAAHVACYFNQPLALALLLDAGASMTARGKLGRTPLIMAAARGATGCMELLLARGGNALDLDAKQTFLDNTALHLAASNGRSQDVSLLVHAGADPTITTTLRLTPLQLARSQGDNNQECVVLLEATLVEPQRPRALFKARALFDAAHAVAKARSDARTRAGEHRAAVAAAPVYLRQRVGQGRELPRVEVVEGQASEELVACLKYALGLEGGGVVLFEGQEPSVGMVPQVLVELLELMVPKWDPARKGRMLGEGHIALGGGGGGGEGEGGVGGCICS